MTNSHSTWEVYHRHHQFGGTNSHFTPTQATLAFENQEEGFIAKLLVSQGTKDIPVGRPLAVLVEDKASIGAFVHFAPGGPKVGMETSAHQAADLTSAKVTASPALYPPHTVSSQC